MKRFDLTFKGDILPDHEPEQVRDGFAELFRIRDPLVLDELFSGDAFVLRSNLDRKAAADYFRKIADIGGIAELVASDAAAANADSLPSEVFTRVAPEDPAAFRAPRRGEIISAPPIRDEQSQAETALKPQPQETLETDHKAVEPKGPSTEEVLDRLNHLKEEAQAGWESKLEQLQQMQDEVKQDCSEALQRIKHQRGC